uniref:Small ribosomal subunit protein uS17c n=1 Tax=Kalanchoe fedtschenkoi TaxID=63787 RepID=A0A7N0REW9_KALFE
MSSSFLLLHPSPPLKFAMTLSNPFIHGSSPALPLLAKPTAPLTTVAHTFTPFVRAMKSLQGRVIATVNDKTVAVEVTRLAPHPKYKRRVRKKKKYQAHDPDNIFKVGDFVQLEKCRPISKTKTFLAIPLPDKRIK